MNYHNLQNWISQKLLWSLRCGVKQDCCGWHLVFALAQKNNLAISYKQIRAWNEVFCYYLSLGHLFSFRRAVVKSYVHTMKIQPFNNLQSFVVKLCNFACTQSTKIGWKISSRRSKFLFYSHTVVQRYNSKKTDVLGSNLSTDFWKRAHLLSRILFEKNIMSSVIRGEKRLSCEPILNDWFGSISVQLLFF